MDSCGCSTHVTLAFTTQHPSQFVITYLQALAMMSSTVVLPLITVQDDFQTVIADVQDATVPQESFWISCYKQNCESVHGRVSVQPKQGRLHGITTTTGSGLDLIPDKVEFRTDQHNVYFVACPPLSIPPTKLRVPRQVIGQPSQKPNEFTAFDVAPDASIYATGDHNGNVSVGSTSGSGSASKFKNAVHASTILSLRFFPSSKVILTAGNDFTLAVISAEDLSVPRKLKGHTRAVTDCGIISKGRNVLSCSKDGTLRLWDVGSGSQIRAFSSNDYSPVHKLALGIKDVDRKFYSPDGERTVEPPPPSVDPREVEVDDKVAFGALNNGTFEAFDLRSKLSFFHSDVSSVSGKAPLESMAYSSTDHMLATGSRLGIISIYDTRQMSEALVTLHRNTSSIEDLVFLSSGNGEVRLGVASADGLPFIASLKPEGPQVIEELVGYNCDAVRSIRAVDGAIWTAGDDGLVKRY